MELKIENLTKQYGNKMALQNVSFTLKPGMVGLLGANGATYENDMWCYEADFRYSQIGKL